MTQVFSRPGFALLPDSPAATEGPAPRFMPGTRIDTPDSPRAVELLQAGDDVVTRDGPRRVARIGLRSVAREDWTYRRAIWPVRVPVGSLGNAVPLRLAPAQRVRLAGIALETVMGVDALWVRIDQLVGLRGLASERPLGALRQYGVALEGGDAVRAEGVWCALDDAGEAPDRERVRAAFTAMNAAGEPRIV